jgi:hypothetical protein
MLTAHSKQEEIREAELKAQNEMMERIAQQRMQIQDIYLDEMVMESERGDYKSKGGKRMPAKVVRCCVLCALCAMVIFGF